MSKKTNYSFQILGVIFVIPFISTVIFNQMLLEIFFNNYFESYYYVQSDKKQTSRDRQEIVE